MRSLKITLIAMIGLFTLSLQVLPVQSAGLSTVEATTPTINVPLTTWNELKANNEKALNLIRQSRIPLSEVQALTVKQANELQELKSINNKQASELMKAQNDLMKQNAYLNEMNNSLNELSKDIKKNKATEQRLHRQRNTWALISGLLLVGIAIK
ncbi:hypothetical protein [Veillonella sp. VA142]|uniref:hypothetical protein n=1 Tax=Veillonella sp. VA142 TaxID=741834 RepID=UPI000F8D7E97|nr:hypothetical protein [Veillonella sp. VA142]